MTSLARVIDQSTTRIVRPRNGGRIGIDHEPVRITPSLVGEVGRERMLRDVLAALAPVAISPTLTQLYYGRNTNPSAFALQCPARTAADPVIS